MEGCSKRETSDRNWLENDNVRLQKQADGRIVPLKFPAPSHPVAPQNARQTHSRPDKNTRSVDVYCPSASKDRSKASKKPRDRKNAYRQTREMVSSKCTSVDVELRLSTSFQRGKACRSHLPPPHRTSPKHQNTKKKHHQPAQLSIWQTMTTRSKRIGPIGG
ncbi:hypothetical protein CONLIGDRAFT_317838 [Coniochaeta ligniaria NRRL 30616]|uniref:Uncharacterized protein n=1 Tax=Coniochaeta ligniaria NRRL 30616 TaxID=1408157 RepID=A0A1J7JPZ5_9PEZI|nr:hypothetical protein CONLIGDRAFT_317838 [Coniochaeta ligniaria NRRL 30616]